MGAVVESTGKLEGPPVSVVVVSYNTPQRLESCLTSLSRQPAAEIFVIDCSDRDPAEFLRRRFPGVQFRHFERKLPVPQLRREGIRASSSELVALIESWMTPCEGWVEALRQAHGRYPGAAVVGGPIAFPCGGAKATLLEWADYFSEYGEQIPGAADSAATDERADVSEAGLAENISGANCSYRRWALEECADLVEQGAWEPEIHQRLRERGHELRLAPGAVACYRKPAPLGSLLLQRFRYGRAHGAGRLRGASWARRLARAVLAPLVPAVLFGRLWRRVEHAPRAPTRLLTSAGWLLLLYGAWALGEALGICFGAGSAGDSIF